MPCYDCPKCRDYIGNYNVIKQLLKDCAIVTAVRKLVAEDTEANYDALKVLVDAKLVALGSPNSRVVFAKSDGKYIFDNTLTFAESAEVENHNSRLEFQLAIDYHLGVDASKGVPEFWKSKYANGGYAIASRTSSTVGAPSNYVAKFVSRCAGATDPEAFTARVS